MWFWKGVLTALFIPLAGMYHASRLFIGREKARDFYYDKIVKVSAKVLSWNIRTLKQDEEFRIFSKNFTKALSKMPFEIIKVTEDTDTRLQINITRCQFTEVFKLLGMSDLTKALCDGDVAFCEKYQPQIDFDRHHTIEQGDDFCDHTFISNQQP